MLDSYIDIDTLPEPLRQEAKNIEADYRTLLLFNESYREEMRAILDIVRDEFIVRVNDLLLIEA